MLYIKKSDTNDFFVYRSHIPKDFAIAVYKVMHNLASIHEWQLFDKMINEKKPVLQWVKEILLDNGVDNIDKELNWWKEQLFYPYN